MALQSEYFDPDTGIIHIYQTDLNQVASGVTDSTTVGLNNTSFNDVKVKLLSVEYRLKMFPIPSPTPEDFNTQAFSTSFDSQGLLICGIGNENENFDLFTSAAIFEGTSSWPVHIQGWHAMIGDPQRISKTWKPRKTGLSNEQVAFVAVRNEGAAIMYYHVSLYMRVLRL